MIQGRNDTVVFRGVEYHIQSEDTGKRIETHIYCRGKILKSYFTDYDPQRSCAEEIKNLLIQQHKQALRDIRDGKVGPS